MSWFRLYLMAPLLIGIISAFFSDRKKVFFWLYGVATFLFFGLRTKYLGSGDSLFYYNLWERLGTIPFTFENLKLVFSIDLEQGFLLCVWTLSHILKSGQYVFIFAGAIYSFCLCRFFFDNCEDYVLGPLMGGSIGLTGFFLQGMRQSIAISLCLLAVKSCKERKLFCFLLWVGLASLFHASALLFVLVYPIYGICLNWKSITLIGVLGLVGPTLLSQLTLLANIFMNESYVGGHDEQAIGGTITFIMYLVLILYCFIVRNERHPCVNSIISYTEYSYAYFLFLLCVLFYSMRFFYITVFERASYYFLPFAPVAVCATFQRYTKKSRHLVQMVFYVVFCLLAMYKSGGSSPLSEYAFFWSSL